MTAPTACCPKIGCAASDCWPAPGRPTTDTSASAAAQAGLLDALLASQPEASCDEAFARVREELASCFRVSSPPDSPPASSAICATISAKAWAGWSSCGASRSAAAWPTTWASAKPRRCWRCWRPAASCAPPARPSPSLVVVPRSLVFNWKQEAERFTPATTRARLHRVRIGNGRPIWRATTWSSPPTAPCGGCRPPQRYRVRLHRARRSPGHQERRHGIGQGRSVAAWRPIAWR